MCVCCLITFKKRTKCANIYTGVQVLKYHTSSSSVYIDTLVILKNTREGQYMTHTSYFNYIHMCTYIKYFIFNIYALIHEYKIHSPHFSHIKILKISSFINSIKLSIIPFHLTRFLPMNCYIANVSFFYFFQY